MQLSLALLLVASASSALARRLVVELVDVVGSPTPETRVATLIYSNDGEEHRVEGLMDGCKYNKGDIGEVCVDWGHDPKRAHFKYKNQPEKYCFKFHNKTTSGSGSRYIFGETGCSW